MIKNENEISRAIEVYRAEVEAHGLTVDQLHDFEFLAEICAERDKQDEQTFSLTEPFSTRHFDLAPNTAFWLAVRDAEGRIISVQAARFDPIGRRTLAEHWQLQHRRIHVEPYPDQSPALGEDHCPAAREITGNVVYHGNMWLAPEWLGKKLGTPLCRMGQLIAHLKWDLDFIYCFIETRLVQKGFAAHQGYSHIQPMGTDWTRPPGHIHADDYLCWNTPVDLDHLARATTLWGQGALSNSQSVAGRRQEAEQ